MLFQGPAWQPSRGGKCQCFDVVFVLFFTMSVCGHGGHSSVFPCGAAPAPCTRALQHLVLSARRKRSAMNNMDEEPRKTVCRGHDYVELVLDTGQWPESCQ